MELSEKKFGQDVMAWRLKSQLSRASLAKMLGVQTKTLQHVELGYQNLGPSARQIVEQLMRGDASPGSIPREPSISSVVQDTQPAIDAVIAIMLDPANQQRAQAVSEALSIPIERAWKILVSEKTRR